MAEIFWQSNMALLRTLILLVGSYVGLILFLRISGKRTLSKMNAFDLVVTVALGSTLATISLSKDVALAQGMLALFLLIFCQYVVAALAVRSSSFRKIIKSEPKLLFASGAFLEERLREERVTADEVYAAVRSQGMADLENVGAVVLETDGSFSVLKKSDQIKQSTLQGVRGRREAS